MTKALGNLLRSATEGEGDLVTVRTELDLIRDYLHIQSTRFGPRLDFAIAVSDEVFDFRLPKLSVQPVVENAIQHVLEVRPGRTAVRIAGGLCADGSGEISVRDDGPGIGQARLEEIRDGVAEKSSRHIGIGLKNIDDRLRILFGERYGLKIESQPGSYTLVTMRFPGLKEDAREGANRVLSDRCG